MKTFIQKGLAAICSLLIAAGLPIASMMASAEDVSLDFEAEKVEDQIILSANVAGLDQAAGHVWNVLEYSIEYDADQVTPVRQTNNVGVPSDYLPGNANNNATIEVILNTNPVLVGAISSRGQFLNGTVMTLAFDLRDGVAAEDVELTVNVTQFAKSVVVDGQAQNPVDLVAPGSYTVEIVVNSNVDSIAVTKQPDKTDYQWGEELDLTGAELTAFYNDGTMETVAVTSDMVSGYDPYKTGQQPLTVTYGGRTTTFVVTVEGPVLPSSIAVTRRPDKTDYQWGEELDLTGGELTVFYNDGSTETVTIAPGMVSGYDKNTRGDQQVTISYGGKSAAFTVSVYRPGDVDENDDVTANDALMALQAATDKIELSGAMLLAADVNEDGVVSASDALQILQYSIQKITEFTPAVDVLPPSASSGATLDFAAEKVGDQIILSVNVGGMDGTFNPYDEYTNAWNVLEYSVAYDADQVTPVQQPGVIGVPSDYLSGSANRGATIEVNLNANPVLVGAISSRGQFLNGTVMTLAFDLRDGVAAEDVKLTVGVSQFAKAVIVDEKMEALQNLVAPGYTILPAATLNSIAVTRRPDKTDYQWGEELDLTGGELTVFYNDGSTETVTIAPGMVSGYDKNTRGDQQVTISYGGKSAAFTVSVYRPGDVDENDGVTANDALMALQAATDKIELSGAMLLAADVNEDGVVSANDALQILQYAIERITEFTPAVDVLPPSASSGASLDFVTTEADGQIILSVNVAGMDGVYSEHNEYTNAWNVLEYNIAYDADQVTPVPQPDTDGAPIDFVTGEAVRTGATIVVNLDTNPVLVGAISSDGQFRNGEVMTIAFKLKDGVAAEDVELTVGVSQFAKAVIVDGKMEALQNLVAPGYTILPAATLNSIAVTRRPDKTDYQWGEELDLTGAELTAFYNDGTMETVAITSDMVSGYDPHKIGQQPLTVTYRGKTTTFVVAVEGPALPSSIAVTRQPDKTDYQQGEELDLTGAELTAFYDDGSTETVAITSDMVSGYDSAKIGPQALTVTYKGKTTTFVVTVNEPVMPESIVITKSPDKTAYRLGEELDLTGAELTAFYDDGSTETVAITPDMVSGYDSAKIGTQALTVIYKGKTTTFAATVYRPGDVNLDGEVKSEDALITLQAATHKIELDGAAALAANVNGDAEISSVDALQILQYATQKIDSVSGAQEVNR